MMAACCLYHSSKLQIYIKTEITPDFSGGHANILPKKIGVIIENELNKMPRL